MLQKDRPTVVRPPPRSGADPAPAPTPRPPRVPSVPTTTRARCPAHAARVHFRRAQPPLLPRHRRVFAADRNANPFLGPLRGLREARCPGPLDAQRTRTRGSTREADGARSGQHARGVAAGEGPTPSASLGSATAAAPGPWRGPASGRRVRGDAGPCPPRAGLDRPPALRLQPSARLHRGPSARLPRPPRHRVSPTSPRGPDAGLGPGDAHSPQPGASRPPPSDSGGGAAPGTAGPVPARRGSPGRRRQASHPRPHCGGHDSRSVWTRHLDPN